MEEHPLPCLKDGAYTVVMGWPHASGSAGLAEPRYDPSLGRGQGIPMCLSLGFVFPLLTAIVKRETLRACVTVSCCPVWLVAVCLESGFFHLMSSRSVLAVSVRMHFLLKAE